MTRLPLSSYWASHSGLCFLVSFAAKTRGWTGGSPWFLPALTSSPIVQSSTGAGLQCCHLVSTRAVHLQTCWNQLHLHSAFPVSPWQTVTRGQRAEGKTLTRKKREETQQTSPWQAAIVPAQQSKHCQGSRERRARRGQLSHLGLLICKMRRFAQTISSCKSLELWVETGISGLGLHVINLNSSFSSVRPVQQRHRQTKGGLCLWGADDRNQAAVSENESPGPQNAWRNLINTPKSENKDRPGFQQTRMPGKVLSGDQWGPECFRLWWFTLGSTWGQGRRPTVYEVRSGGLWHGRPGVCTVFCRQPGVSEVSAQSTGLSELRLGNTTQTAAARSRINRTGQRVS